MHQLPVSRFTKINSIHLHYLDWGGTGPPMIFLAGRGNSAYIFDKFANRFTHQYRVFGLTRRGHGDSDRPSTGYDVETLTNDLRAFLDFQNINKTILAGHSMANVELCHFSTLYPNRVDKLIFLDSAYDRTRIKTLRQQNPLQEIKAPQQDHYTIESYSNYLKEIRPDIAEVWSEVWEEEILHITEKNSDGKIVEKMTDKILENLHRNVYQYSPKASAIKAPTLSFFAIWDKPYFPGYLSKEQRKVVSRFVSTVQATIQRECINQFKRDVPHAEIVEIPSGHHYCFMKHEGIVFEKMMNFLSAGG